MPERGRYGAIWRNDCWHVSIERVWSAVRRWAKRNGKEYVGSFGVVDVAPT